MDSRKEEEGSKGKNKKEEECEIPDKKKEVPNDISFKGKSFETIVKSR